MINTEKFLLFGLVLMIFQSVYGNLSESQYKIALDRMRDACIEKFKTVTPEKTEKIRNGFFPQDDKDLQCYANCIWERLGAMKNGVFDAEHQIEEVDIVMPVSILDSYKIGIRQCKDDGKGAKDTCEAAYKILECFIAFVPDFYFP